MFVNLRKESVSIWFSSGHPLLVNVMLDLTLHRFEGSLISNNIEQTSNLSAQPLAKFATFG